MNPYNQWNDQKGTDADTVIAQVIGESGHKRPSLIQRAYMSIANGLSAIMVPRGGTPPAAGPGAVLVNGVTRALAAGRGSSASVAGYVPRSALLNSAGCGENDQKLGTDGSDFVGMAHINAIPDSGIRLGICR